MFEHSTIFQWQTNRNFSVHVFPKLGVVGHLSYSCPEHANVMAKLYQMLVEVKLVFDDGGAAASWWCAHAYVHKCVCVRLLEWKDGCVCVHVCVFVFIFSSLCCDCFLEGAIKAFWSGLTEWCCFPWFVVFQKCFTFHSTQQRVSCWSWKLKIMMSFVCADIRRALTFHRAACSLHGFCPCNPMKLSLFLYLCQDWFCRF